ncbi:LamG domain-containing protein [Flavobacterium gilvum]|uniref:LamG-like jellyroll fold domain-containing protein n=1 Tax=Flavobacterium gilvum TaxID=1492737 RepID=A0AAC9N7H5_9FLAO|nr:LamG domain-containing protein [Flavobacterium gilvum]AOW10498.1 hypothetical protein EM308_13850 [Flavobacterium gilvum]KFC59657.1 hypothetical protein FEM08_15720 [Flavobacterium gilvum]
MKKIFLSTLLFAFLISANAQTPIQEFNFNGSLNNVKKDVAFSGTVYYVKDRAGVANGAIHVCSTVLETTIPNLPVSNAARTVSVWVKYKDVTKANYIWGYGNTLNAQYFGLLQQSTTNSKSDLNLAGWGPTNDVIVTTAIASDVWYNYIVTYDGLVSKIYKNGELIKSSLGPKKNTFSSAFWMGKIGSNVSIDADIDDLKIFDIALTTDEVARLYANSLMQNSNYDSIAVANATEKKVVLTTTAKTTKTGIEKSDVVLSVPEETLPVKTSEIYSEKGLKVYRTDKNKIDISNLPEGTYMLKVTNSQNGSMNQKLTAN